MKPTKNRIFCPGCQRCKMLFESEKEALLFMKYNNEDIMRKKHFSPQRAYFCTSCGGWHLTHHQQSNHQLSIFEKAIEMNKSLNEMKKISKLRRGIIRNETAKYVNNLLSEAEKCLVAGEKKKAVEILESIMEMSKTKYISSKILKDIELKINRLKTK